MKRYTLFLLLSLGMLSACAPGAPTPFAATAPAQQQVNIVASATPSDTPTQTYTPSNTPTATSTNTPTPTNTPTNTPTPTDTLTPTITPSPTVTPSPTPSLTPTPTETLAPILTATPANPASDPNYTPPPTWTPPPANPSVFIDDHYRLRRPIASGGVNYVDRTYPYGSTAGGRYRVHHGVEFQNPLGTPVLAAANGTVYYAGDDRTRQFGPQFNYYGNLVIIEHPFTTAQGQSVYTLYGHLSSLDVQTGQQVSVGDRVGAVGAEGVALGSHLHFEVRVGNPDSFNATRNPDLWIAPYFGYGTLAGRVTDAAGNLLRDVTVQVESASGQDFVPRYAFSYAGDTVNSDSTFGENFTMGDLPANYYDVTVRANGRRLFQEAIYIYPDRTTWLDIQLNN